MKVAFAGWVPGGNGEMVAKGAESDVVYCDDCGWDSGDVESNEELKKLVKEAGGHLTLGGEEDDEPDRCPQCGSSNLRVD